MKNIFFLLLVAILTGCATHRELEIGQKCLPCKQYFSEAAPHQTRVKDFTVAPLCAKCWHKLTPQERVAYYDRVFGFYGREYPATITNVTLVEIETEVLKGK